MASVPSAAVKYITDNCPYPAGVIGCRAALRQLSYSCCEYDIAIFCKNGKPNIHRIVILDGIIIKFISFSKFDEIDYVSIRDMIILKDYDSFFVSSLLAKLKEKRYNEILKTFGKKKIIESLFLTEAINRNLSKYPQLSSLWLKMAAYHFTEGILAIHGVKSSPVHELDQIRCLGMKGRKIVSGIESALDCIGIERAGRSAISRSLKVIETLNKEEFSYGLWLTKSRWLLSQGRVADCYYYIGKLAAGYFASKDEIFLRRNLQPIEILLDLTRDSHSIYKLHSQLVRASKEALRT
jgi:hypothetical protein